MRLLFILALGLAAGGCQARKAYTSDRILDDCLDSGKTEFQCKRSLGCSESQSLAECRNSFKNRHKFYIHY